MPREINSRRTTRPASTTAARAETSGLSPYGTEVPLLRPPSGQAASAMKPTVAQNVCGSEPPPVAGSGFAATTMVATPPAARMSRALGRPELALNSGPTVMRAASVTPERDRVTHRSTRPSAAAAAR